MLIFISHDYEKSLGFGGLSPGFSYFQVVRSGIYIVVVYTLWPYICCGSILSLV